MDTSPTMVKLSDLKRNPSNPRIISNADFKRLKKSIKEFPKMMSLRPIIHRDHVVIAGNQRHQMLEELGYKDIPEEWIKDAKDLTEEEVKRFIMLDNEPFGKNDWEMLKSTWDIPQLEEWGIDLPDFPAKDETPPTDETREPNTLVIKFSKPEDFRKIKEKLREAGETYEKGAIKIFGAYKQVKKA